MRQAKASAQFLASLVQGLRNGLIFEIAGPSEGRIKWTATRFRLARDHRLHEGDIVLQIQTEVHSRSGNKTISSWSFCSWTADGLAQLISEVQDPTGTSTDLPAAERGDPIVDRLIDLAEHGSAQLGSYQYQLDDESFSIDDNGTLIQANEIQHRADDWISLQLSSDQLAKIPDDHIASRR